MSAELRQRAAVVATFISHGLLFAAWTPHIPHVEGKLGLSDATLGLILLATPVGSVASMLITGRVLPRLGSRTMVRICVAGYAAVGPFVGLAATPAELALALLFWGAFQGSLDVSMNTQAVAVQRGQRRHLMPVFHGTWSIGAFAGAGLGALAVALGVGLAVEELVLAVPVLVAAALLTPAMLPDDAGREQAAPEPALGGAPGGSGRRSRAVIVLSAVAFASMLCEGAAGDWSAVYLKGSAHAGAALAGFGYGAFALVMALVRLGGGRLLAAVPAPRLLPALAGIASAGMAFALAVGSAAPALIGFACLGAGTALVVPTVFTAAGNLGGFRPGVGIAVVSGFGWAGFVCGPPLIGALAGLTTLRAALVLVPVLTAAIALATARAASIRAGAEAPDAA